VTCLLLICAAERGMGLAAETGVARMVLLLFPDTEAAFTISGVQVIVLAEGAAAAAAAPFLGRIVLRSASGSFTRAEISRCACLVASGEPLKQKNQELVSSHTTTFDFSTSSSFKTFMININMIIN
jgi:hypothetical protein